MLGLCGVGIEELMASNLYSAENLNNNKCQVTLYVIVTVVVKKSVASEVF